MILINRTEFILAQILGAVVFSRPNMRAAFFSWGNDAAVLLFILCSSYFIYIFYSRVIDANKSICFAHGYVLLRMIPLFIVRLSSISHILSFILCVIFCFYRESLIAVITYQDENRAMEKLKQIKEFSQEESLEVLMDVARKTGKCRVLKYLEDLK